MSYLMSIAWASVEDYLDTQPDNVTIEIRKKMFSSSELFDMEWEDVLKKKELCSLIYMALEQWEKKNFVGTGLSRSRIGDVRSMMSDLQSVVSVS